MYSFQENDEIYRFICITIAVLIVLCSITFFVNIICIRVAINVYLGKQE
jgi:hypothetical protein